jgi:hypothetical protein
MTENNKPKTFKVDIQELTIDDIETIEEMTGMPIDKIGDPDSPKGKLMRALAYIKARKTDPDATPESVGSLVLDMGGSKKVDPTVASE